MAIIDPIYLIDDYSLTISTGRGAHGPPPKSTPKPTEDPMSIRSTIPAAAFTMAASLGAAHASPLKPIEGQSIRLGDLSGAAHQGTPTTSRAVPMAAPTSM
ncbi:hypothetical protein ACVW1C_007435 [Bradyrhizobium sp. USDA 4011]